MPFDDSLYGRPTGWFHQGNFGDGTSADFPDGIGGEPGTGGLTQNFGLFADADRSGIGNLGTTLTIAGATVSTAINPVCIFRAQDATASAWAPYAGTVTGASGGGNLIISTGGTGANPTIGQDTPFTDNTTKSVEFFGDGSTSDSRPATSNCAHYYKAETNGDWNWTGDVCIEAVLMKQSLAAGLSMPFGTNVNSNAAQPFRGAGLYFSDGPSFGILYRGGAASTLADASAIFANNRWFHVMGFWNQNNGGGSFNGMSRWYVNGVHYDDGTPPDLIAQVDNTIDGFCIGNAGYDNAANNWSFSGKVAYVAAWQQINWLGNSLTYNTGCDNVAKQRFQDLIGVKASTAGGSAYPTTMTRASSAYLQKVDSTGRRKYFLVGDNWMRHEREDDVAGDSIYGIRSESQVQNVIIQSDDLTDAAWTATTCTVSGTTASPYENLTIDGVVGDNATAQMTVGQAPVTSVSDAWVAHMHCKRGTSDWVYFEDDTIGANAHAWFNINGGYLGTVGSSITYATIENLNDDIWKCSVNWTPNGINDTLNWGPSNADNTTDCTGNGAAVNVYMGLAGAGTSQSRPWSHISTAASAVSRVKDDLTYSATSNAPTSGKMTVHWDYIRPARSGDIASGAGNGRYWMIENGSTNSQFAFERLDSTMQCNVNTGGSTVATFIDSQVSSDSLIHSSTVTLVTNDGKMYVDASLRATDTALTIGTSPANIQIGQNESNGAHCNGIMGDFRIYNRATTEGLLNEKVEPMAYGELYVSTPSGGQTLSATPALAVDVTTLDTALNFDMPSSFRLRYTGQLTKKFHVLAHLSMQKTSAGGGATMTAYIAKNGTFDATTAIIRYVANQNQEGAATCGGLFELSQNDYVEVYWKDDGGEDWEIVAGNMAAIEIS